MRKRKSVCGLCKPTKKWKRRNNRITNSNKSLFKNECDSDVKLRILRK